MSPYGIAIATIAVDEEELWDAIYDFMVSTLGWVSLSTYSLYPLIGGPDKAAVLYSSGESGIEDIYVGIYESQLDFSNLATLQFQLYTGYNAACSFCNQPGALCCGECQMGRTTLPPSGGLESWCGLPSLPLEGTSPPGRNWYWLYGDKDAVVIITRTAASGDVFYHSAYLGVVDRFLSTVQDPRPVYGVGSGHHCGGGNRCCWNDPYANSWAFGLTGLCPIKYIRDRTDSCWVCSRYTCKFVADATCGWIAYGIFENVCNQPSVFGAGRTLNQINVANHPDGIRGNLKHVYAVGKAGLTADTTLTIDGNNYRVFPNLLGSLDEDRWLAVRDYV